MDNDIGAFEKHTKGIGMKLFAKMGYKGRGLGKHGQGIVVPFMAKVRPFRMGMGFNDEYKEKKKAISVSVAISESNQERLWSKPAQERYKTKKRKKRDYITADENLKRKQKHGIESVQKVLDMRGRKVRVFANLEILNAEEKAREKDLALPELLRLYAKFIVGSAELDVQKIDQGLRNERETLIALQREKEKFESDVAKQKKQLSSMENIVGFFDEVGEENSIRKLTLESLANAFSDLQRQYPDDYKICNLSYIACSYAIPLFIRVFQGWDPLQNPTHGVNIISIWKSLLDGEDIFDSRDVVSTYTQLFTEVVFPAIRLSGTNSWQARDPEPMLRLLESWEKLIPPSVLQSVLDNIVMPKLSSAVDSWDPRVEAIPIHAWIHPWLPLLGPKLETFYHTIRSRLGIVLHEWHPSDTSAYNILSPWKTVFDPVSWEKLMVRFILPKLLSVMHEFHVNPADQKYDQFYWILAWVTAIPIHHMIQLLDIFFEKWIQVLYQRLCSDPNFEDVAQWYLGWKERIPKELLTNEHVTYRVNLGLEMMNQAVEGMSVVQPGMRVLEQKKIEAQLKAVGASQFLANANTQMEGLYMSLKEVIEEHAQRNGLLFKPKPGRMQDGHQIYAFGSVSIIIDSLNQKVFAQVEHRWGLVSLEKLLEMQSDGLRRR